MADEQSSDPIITIRLKKGLADRHRVPLADILRVLDEFRLMISEVGRRIQRERGMANPTGDFGLEVVASDNTPIFHKGSVEMPIAMTMNTTTGLLATQEVLSSFEVLASENGIPEPDRKIDQSILRRMSRVARVQRKDRMEMEIRIDRPGFSGTQKATFGSSAMDTLRAMQTPTLRVDGVSLYGKLVQLMDPDFSDDTEKGFWGSLIRSDGQSWRVQFRSGRGEEANHLFRQQVHVKGTAVYYRVASPKIIVDSIAADTDRDYENAFDEMFGNYRDVFKRDLSALVKEMREE